MKKIAKIKILGGKALLLALFSCFVAWGLLANSATARTCYDQYGRPIPCPPIKVTLEKGVRLQGTDTYRSVISGVLDKQKLFYRIVVSNTGGETISNLKLKDALVVPANRKNIMITSLLE